jgi:hypothetical protein
MLCTLIGTIVYLLYGRRDSCHCWNGHQQSSTASSSFAQVARQIENAELIQGTYGMLHQSTKQSWIASPVAAGNCVHQVYVTTVV